MKKTYSIVGTKFANSENFVLSLKPGVELALIREPDNKFDKNAIAVYCGERKIGYLPAKQNSGIAMAMDAELKGPSAAALIAAGQVVTPIKPGIFRLSPNSAFPQVEVEE